MATALTRFPRFGNRLTVAQYMTLPDDGNKYELFEGELVMSPSYFFEHGRVVGFVFAELDRFVSARSLGLVGMDTDVIMARFGTVLRPDVCFISTKRLSIVKGHIHGSPDLAIEVTSPGNWQNDVHFKKRQYERFGIREYCVLDIAEARNRAFRWVSRRGRFSGGLIRGDVLKLTTVRGFSVDLRDIWSVAAGGRRERRSLS